jgi:hypothetical protein
VKTESQIGNRFFDYIMKGQYQTTPIGQDKKLRTRLLNELNPIVSGEWVDIEIDRKYQGEL